MKFGVREICNVVLKTKAAQKIGKKIFYAGEPVIYFDTLKTSKIEGTGQIVYATGGRGNARLAAWEGEREVTFTMEDALISPEGFMILSGAGLVEASEAKPIYQHITETIDKNEKFQNAAGVLQSRVVVDEENSLKIGLYEKPYLPVDQGDNFAYVMFRKGDDMITEPYIPVHQETLESATTSEGKTIYWMTVANHKVYSSFNDDEQSTDPQGHNPGTYSVDSLPDVLDYDSLVIDYYVARTANAKQMEIRADKFGGHYYLEAETLFRNTDGVDVPAEFIIPNCKVKSDFTFEMSNSGDPSTFNFEMEAFPDYTRFDHSKKVLFDLQMIEDVTQIDLHRHSTGHEAAHDALNWDN